MSTFFGLTQSRWLPPAALVVLSAALYLPGLFAIPPVDRDEARFAQATRQMLASGDFTVPRFQDDARLKKPIGIYWLQAAAVSLAGPGARASIGWYRLPSALGALAAVLGTYLLARRFLAPPAALLGAAWLAASALLVVEAHLATTDAVLLAAIVAAQGCLAVLYADARRGRPGRSFARIGFWIAQAAGILVKGPIAPLVSGLTLAALAIAGPRRERAAVAAVVRGLRPLRGAVGLAAVLLPWVVAAGIDAGWGTLREAVGGDVVPKLLGAHESHGGPPGLYVLMAPATFWPGSLALAFGAARAWRLRRRPFERFCLAWLVPTWLFFELMPTKLMHYVLPAFPALALLVARAALAAPARIRPPLRHPAVRAALAAWAVGSAAAGVAVVVAAVALGAGLRPAPFLSAFAAVAMGAICLRRERLVALGVAAAFRPPWRRARTATARGASWQPEGRRYAGPPPLAAVAWMSVAASIAFFAPLLQWTLPELDQLWLSRGAAAAIAAHGADRPVAATGFEEPSLVFLTRGDLVFTGAAGAAAFLRTHADGLALVTGDRQGDFMRAAAGAGVPIGEALCYVDGVNYSKGAPTRLYLYAREDQRGESSPGAILGRTATQRCSDAESR